VCKREKEREMVIRAEGCGLDCRERKAEKQIKRDRDRDTE